MSDSNKKKIITIFGIVLLLAIISYFLLTVTRKNTPHNEFIDNNEEQVIENDDVNDGTNPSDNRNSQNNSDNNGNSNEDKSDVIVDSNTSNIYQVVAVNNGEKITSNNKDVVSWSSGNPSIATVDNNGNITAVSTGTTTITGKKDDGSEVVISVNVRKNKSIQDVDFLKTEGTKFVKVGNNNTVLLRGFNLGEWLSRAISLSPISSASTAASAWDREYADNNAQINYAIKKRFPNRYNELNDAYYNNFINSTDLDKLEEMGVNVVRVPVEWSYFVTFTFFPADGRYTYQMLSGNELEARLKRLDWVVSECRKRGIYVIFDLHVVDGGQNNGGIRSRKGGYTFFKEEGKASRNNAIEIWKIIANRFKDNPGVAAYELLNEPGASNEEIKVYEDYIKETYNTIRNVEKNCKNKHIIIIESPMHGTTGHSLNELKKPSIYGFTNVAYSVHDYFTSNNSILPGNTVEGAGTKDDVKKAIKAKVEQDVNEMKSYGVPLYIGETNFLWKDIEDVWEYAMSLYDFNYINYSFWTYKAANSTSYGLVYNTVQKSNPGVFADLINDPFDTIKNKFSLTTTSAKYTLNSRYFSTIENHIINNDSIPKMGSNEYICNIGEKIISSIKTYSSDGEAKLELISLNNNNVQITKISPTGLICTGSSCQTIEISCLTKGETIVTVTSNFGKTSTSKIIVK